MIERPSSERTASDRRAALHALRVDPIFGDEPHPGDEDLAALIDGRLSPGHRDRVLRYLDRNPDAYQAWLAAAAEIEAGQRQRRPAASRPRILAVASLAAVLLAALLLMPRLISGPTLKERIDAGFAAVKGSGSTPSEMRSSSYGFGSASGTDAIVTAMRTGFDSGSAELAGYPGPDSLASMAPLAFQIGRWIALLQRAAGSGSQPAAFWTGQALIARQLEQAAPALGPSATAETIRAELRVLRAMLDRSATDASERRRRDLDVELGRVRLRFGLEGTPPDVR